MCTLLAVVGGVLAVVLVVVVEGALAFTSAALALRV